MHPQKGGRGGGFQLQVVVERIAEVRIVQILFQLRGGHDAGNPIPHQQPLEAAGHDGVRIQGLGELILLAGDDHQGAGAAVQPGPADGGGDFPADFVAGLQAAQVFRPRRRQGAGQDVPAPGHIL